MEYLLSEYGEAIEYDLCTICHVDLATLLAQNRVRLLLNLIDHLPSNSYYFDERAHDEQQARYVLEHPELMKDSGGRGDFANWTTLNAQMADVIDLLKVNINIARAVGGDKHPPKIQPSYRPVSMIQKVQELLDQEAHERLVSRVLIAGYNEDQFAE